MDPQMLRLFKSTIPKLTFNAHKGQCGRVCVIGGALEYTGAAFFAAISALKVGADLSYVLSTTEATPVIKTHSPELIVFPYLNTDDGPKHFVDTVLPNLHSLVIGPGLGRASKLASVLDFIVSRAKDKNLPIIFDADGLYFLNQNIKLVQNYTNAILTPNAMEFRRLHATISQLDSSLPQLDESSEESLSKATVSLARILAGPTVVRKGIVDIISDGTSVTIVREEGSPRRCGGQGDVLSGSLGTFAFWSSRRSLDTSASSSKFTWQLAASSAASAFTRRCSLGAFIKHGRSTTTSDLISEIPSTFEDMFAEAKTAL